MLKEDGNHTLDTAFANLALDIANGAGADLIDLHREINDAVERANHFGASPLVEGTANFVKDNIVDIGLLIGCFVAPEYTIPKALIALYGGTKKVTQLRTRYAELKEQRLDKRTILLVITLDCMKDTASGYFIGSIAGKAGNKAGTFAKDKGASAKNAKRTNNTINSAINSTSKW